MLNQFAVDFRKRVERAYQLSDYTSYRSLSLDVDWSPSILHKLVNGKFDYSKDGPGFFGTTRLCEKLGVTPNFLAGTKQWTQSPTAEAIDALEFLQSIEETRSRPTIGKLIHAYVRSGQRLEAFKQFMEHCDVYELPDLETRKVQIRSIGARSLSALRMGEANTVILQEAYDQADPAFQEHIFGGHERTLASGMTIEVDAIDQRMNNHPRHVKIEYTRVAMHLKDAEGTECILIYCELIPQ